MSVQALSCAMAITGVSASEKLLLLVLANYADEAMACFPSHRRLATDSCLTERTILSLLKSLEEKRLIRRTERKRPDGSRATDLITLHFSGEVISPRGETDGEQVGKLTAGGGAMISPLTSFEPSLEPSLEPDAFTMAWKAFPEAGRKRSTTKKSKPQWVAASRAARGEAKLVRAVERFSASEDARRDGGKYVPAFDRWLRDGFWEHWVETAPVAVVTSLDPWPRRVREFRRNGYWHPDWGPKPGKPGCQVPPNVLEETAA